jgi:hypothetical protein
MKKTAIVLFLLASLPCLAQTDNTFYVKQFPGTTVGAKIAAAQNACNSNTSIKCVIVIDPSLAAWAAGTNPIQCARCIWIDYRTATPFPNVVNACPMSIGTSGGIIGCYTATLFASGASTDLTTALTIGGNAAQGFYTNISTQRSISGASLFFDNFHDENTFTSTVTGGYATIDANTNILATTTLLSHVVAFQDRQSINGPVTTLIGIDTEVVINSTVSYMNDFHAYDWTGTGSVGSRTVILIDSFAGGHTGYGIYDQSPNDYFAGAVQFGSTLSFPNNGIMSINGIAPGITAANFSITGTTGNITLSPENTLTATFNNSTGLTMAANTSIHLSGSGALISAGQSSVQDLYATGSYANYNAGTYLSVYGVDNFTDTSGTPGNLYIQHNNGDVMIGSGAASMLYRCSAAGSARAGAITAVSADCGTAVATKLYVN